MSILDLYISRNPSKFRILKKMAYAKAIWLEDGEAFEGVVPANWIKESEKKLYYPSGMNVLKHYRSLSEPQDSWGVYELLKVKCTGGTFAN